MSNLKKSPWVLHYGGAGCGGCGSEVKACFSPVYDIERMGFVNTGNPANADIFLITGGINEKNRDVVKNIYDHMAEPKIVVAAGACACSGGIFAGNDAVCGADSVVPVDVYIPGCAARPEAVIDGLIKGLEILGRENDAAGTEETDAKAADDAAEEPCADDKMSDVSGGSVKIPVGPQHPMFSEPVKFDLSVEEGKVLNAEIETGFTYKGAEELAASGSFAKAAAVMERIGGNSSFGHSWGITSAIEKAKNIRLTERAEYLRTILMEMTRIQSHLMWFAEMCETVGFESMASNFWTMRENVLDLLEEMTGGRIMLSMCMVGGVRRDVDDELLKAVAEVIEDTKNEFIKLADILLAEASVKDRMAGTGIISEASASALCMSGPAARASGICKDARVGSDLGVYRGRGLDFAPAAAEEGDCLARCRVHAEEIVQSAEFIFRTAEKIPGGSVFIDTKGSDCGEAEIRIELPDGEAVYYVKISSGDKLEALSVRTASYNNLTVLEEVLAGCDVMNVPLIIKSADIKVSGMER